VIETLEMKPIAALLSARIENAIRSHIGGLFHVEHLPNIIRALRAIARRPLNAPSPRWREFWQRPKCTKMHHSGDLRMVHPGSGGSATNATNATLFKTVFCRNTT
jgi:hypothetical protein